MCKTQFTSSGTPMARLGESIAAERERRRSKVITVVDQNDSKFGASSIDNAIARCEKYATPGDMFRIYVVDADNPFPGYVAAWVECDSAGTIATIPNRH